MSLSVRSGWTDPEGRVYLYFKLEEAMEQIGCGHGKAVKLFAELEQIGLIERRKQGLGKPARIYVKNFALSRSDALKESERVCAPSAPQEGTVPVAEQELPVMEPSTPGPAYVRPEPETACTSRDSAPLRPRMLLDSPRAEAQTSRMEKPGLPQNGSQDFPKAEALYRKNETERNQTEFLFSIPSYPPPCAKGWVKMDEMERYRARIRENIEYDRLLEERPLDGEMLEGYVELMAEVCCTPRDFIRISGNELPSGMVKSRFLKLDREHIVYVLDCMNENTTYIRNIRAYTLTALYNAPLTMHSYYAARVNHDLYGSAS